MTSLSQTKSFCKLIYNEILIAKTDNVFIQLFRYTFVGGFSFIVDYGLLVLLTELFNLNYLISATISFIVGLIVNYFISLIWVFNKPLYKNKKVEFLFYSLIGVIGLGINNLILYLFTDQIGIPYYLSKPLAAVIVFLWNFTARRFMLFNAK